MSLVCISSYSVHSYILSFDHVPKLLKFVVILVYFFFFTEYNISLSSIPDVLSSACSGLIERLYYVLKNFYLLLFSFAFFFQNLNFFAEFLIYVTYFLVQLLG
jgi:hypothetical protein